MYQIGDIVVYGTTGVCEIAAITPAPAGGAPGDYYLLRPLYQDGTIYSPVDNTRVKVRPAMGRAEADRLIDRMPHLEGPVLGDEKPALAMERYRQIFSENDSESLVGLILALYAKKQELIRKHRKFGQVDDRSLKRARELLYGELANALGLAPDSVPAYIQSRIGTDTPAVLP